jgi:hypothetical protein
MYKRSKLSADARRCVRLAPPNQVVKASVEVRSVEDPDAFRRRVEGYGAHIRSWMPEYHLMTIESPVTMLMALAEDDDIVQINVSKRMRLA